MAKYIVSGGTKLSGSVTLSGAKNAGFKAMIAALLADSESEIKGLGLISEIDFAKKIITALGAQVTETSDPHNLKINPQGFVNFEIPEEFGSKSRSSMMYVGPLLAKFGKALIPTPGGDIAIGKRPLERHLDGLRALGAEIKYDESHGVYEITAKILNGTHYKFSKVTHTGTETLIMAAVKAQGKTVLENCAQDPEIDNLIDFLVKMGASVRRTLPTTIVIEGVERLEGVEHTIIPDRIEAATFACMALGTGGEIEVHKADPAILQSLLWKVEEIGGGLELKEDAIVFKFLKALRSTDLTTAPYPGFLTDWQPLWSTLMTQAKGESIVHETVHDSRFGFVPNLLKMGAKIDLFNPEVTNPEFVYNFDLADDKPENKHAATIFGPTPLSGTDLEINEIRGGATALLAGMMAKGQTTINDPLDQIKRGYEDLPGKLISLGAKIQAV